MPSKMVKVWIDSDEYYPWYYYSKIGDGPETRPYSPKSPAEVPEEFLEEFDKAVEHISALMDRMEEYDVLSRR